MDLKRTALQNKKGRLKQRSEKEKLTGITMLHWWRF